MDNVSFNGIPASNWGLYLSSYSVEKPSAKVSLIDIPFGDGALDLSEASGEVKYNMRKVTLVLQGVMTTAQMETLATTISNLLHGKKIQIKLDKDPNYYYYGRVNVTYRKIGPAAEIVVDALCDPYKYKNSVTTQNFSVTGSLAITLTNGRKKAYPRITTTASFTVTKDGVNYSYGTVSDQQTTIPLIEGNNSLTLTGTGSVTFVWQEGAL